jgi:hypothetical protein
MIPAWQRSAINTEAKYLQLRHAFETRGCIRVEFKTDALNTKSRQALGRIGATKEGTFRNHMIMPGGRIRHGVYCSVTDNEWPRVKAHLRIECRADWRQTLPLALVAGAVTRRPDGAAAVESGLVRAYRAEFPRHRTARWPAQSSLPAD